MAMINLIALNIITGISAFLLVKYFFVFEHTYDYFITLFIAYFTQIILVTQLLGIFNSLNLLNIYLLNILVLCIVYLAARRAGAAKEDTFVVRFQDTIGTLRLEFTERLLLALILGFALPKIFVNLVNAPFGWDCLNYHFTFPVEWIKHHNLNNPIVAFCDPSPTYYPINGSLFYLWFMLPIKSVFIADLAEVPFFILSFMAVYAIARKMELPRKYAVFSAALFILVPNYFKQLEIAYVDVMVAALFLCALNYLLLLKSDSSARNGLLGCAAIGLMIGTKTTALVFALPLVALFIYFWYKALKRNPRIMVLAVIIIVATGAFSYIRNYLQTGNFLYPLNLDLFGIFSFDDLNISIIDTIMSVNAFERLHGGSSNIKFGLVSSHILEAAGQIVCRYEL